ncbi:MAG: SAM-dependent methyltransferase [Streptosporangiales bacterium]|nr:SAM-dependent methyltransferase [Streptosporangiales bacterium]
MSGSPRFSPQWLALREPADAAARAGSLLELLRPWLPTDRATAIRDLGSGTGSMVRWLAPRLPGPQHWVLCDRDPQLLARAVESVPADAADGTAVTAEPEVGELAAIRAADLAGTTLVTASALLDVLTTTELDALVEACTTAGCPALLTVSVVGRVELDPPHPMDAEIAAAFDDHQRRSAGGHRLLGPDAVAAAAERFMRVGAEVHRRPSPWQLGSADAELTAQWLTGWVTAATEQRPELAPAAADYLRQRLASCTAGAMRAVVRHEDLLALPARRPGATGGSST